MIEGKDKATRNAVANSNAISDSIRYHAPMDSPTANPIAEGSRFGCKLIDAVKHFTEPRMIRKTAVAAREAARLETEAEVERIMEIGKATVEVQELAQRAKFRAINEMLRRQQNIESIVCEALDYQPDHVSDETVDPDWVNRFFRGCEDISDSQMKTILAKILAGEVAQPQSFSRRTLSIVQDMSVVELRTLENFSRYAWELKCDDESVVCVPFTNDIVPSLEFNYHEQLILESFGLSFEARVPLAEGSIARYVDKVHRVIACPGEHSLVCYIMSEHGKQLVSLMTQKAIEKEWYNACLRLFSSNCVKLEPPGTQIA